MKVISRVTSLAQPGVAALGGIETRLVGVVVAALREAFDRDSARLDLERAHIETERARAEAERARAEQALRAELRRQAGDRALAYLRSIGVVGVSAWMLSAALAVWLPGMRQTAPRSLLAAGWAAAFAALGCVFVAWQHASAWSADIDARGPEVPSSTAAMAAPWLLLTALALIGASVLFAL